MKLPTVSSDTAGQEYTIYNSTDVDIEVQTEDSSTIDKASSFIIPSSGRVRFSSTSTEYYSF